MDVIFVDFIITPLKIILDFFKFFGIQEDEDVIVIDVFSVITPEDVMEEFEFISKRPGSFKIFKPIDPDNIVSFILSIKSANISAKSNIFLTDCPETIPGKYLDYSNVFLMSLLKDIECEKNLKAVVLCFIEDRSKIQKIFDLLSLIPIVDNYYLYNRESASPFAKVFTS